MSGQQAAEGPYTTRFESEVVAVDGRQVWLESSYFYAESDGQPADRGTIGDVEVEDVQYVDGEHVHVLAQEPSFRVGQRVLCRIDWAYRMYCMRAHTASHVLYGACRELLSELEYDSVDIGSETIRVDIETPSRIDDDQLIELNERVNRVVWESRSVSWEDVPVADVRDRPEIASGDEKTTRRNGRARLVTIEGETGNEQLTSASNPWDIAVCGGTHVRNTREIGPVTVLGRTALEDDLTRIELAVGPNAIERRSKEKRAALAAKAELGVPVEDVPEKLRRRGERRH